MKVDDIAAVTLFKILCRQEFFHLRECERIALRFIVCINDAAVVACLHIQYFCEEVSVLLGNTALQHDAPALFETAIPGDIIHCSVDAFLLHGLDDIVLCVHCIALERKLRMVRNKHDIRRTARTAQLLRKSESVLPGQFHIQKNGIVCTQIRRPHFRHALHSRDADASMPASPALNLPPQSFQFIIIIFRNEHLH